jgi:hypothetical protein
MKYDSISINSLPKKYSIANYPHQWKVALSLIPHLWNIALFIMPCQWNITLLIIPHQLNIALCIIPPPMKYITANYPRRMIISLLILRLYLCKSFSNFFSYLFRKARKLTCSRNINAQVLNFVCK